MTKVISINRHKHFSFVKEKKKISISNQVFDFTDEEQRNIIDKLANFVARNGPKFEELTKSKQKDNPKFAFLFGGDYHSYYCWKVGLES